MLPQRPRALDPDFAPTNPQDPGVIVPQDDADPAAAGAQVDHHCQVCPTCGNRLTGHRCKLVCTQCGYYMSCADYY